MSMLFFLITASCASQKREMISKSIIKLEGKSSNIRDFIEIDGYYQREDSIRGTAYQMFFEDGTYVAILWFKEGVTERMKRENLSQAIYSWKQKGQIRWGIRWGAYKIEKDTIVGQFFQKGTLIDGWWECVEEKYVIIDRKTLRPIYFKSLFKEDEKSETNPYEISEENSIYKFIPADSLPSSDCWLREEKWIWRNEQDWKDYMEKIKQKKKQ